MGTERVGYRRLYDAMGCSLADREELYITFPLNDLETWLYLGPKPKFGITVSHGGKYVVPGEASLMAISEYKKDASESSYRHRFFTEISCIKQVEVSDEVSERFTPKRSKDIPSCSLSLNKVQYP